jgi:Malectin domain
MQSRDCFFFAAAIPGGFVKWLIGLLSIFFLVCLPATVQSQETIRVNAGGPSYRDAKGQLWSADYGYNTGELSSSARIATVYGSSDPILFESARLGTRSGEDLQYQFPVANGIYTVNLYFAETIFAKLGSRVFDVQMQGETVWSSLDIFAQVGANHALVKSAQISVTDGEVVVRFVHLANANVPIISALEILPVAKASAPSIAKLPATPSITTGQTANFEFVAAETILAGSVPTSKFVP